MGGTVSSSAYQPILASLSQGQRDLINKTPGVADLAKKYGVTMPAAAPREFSWQFPQYSQTWAFTPPAPSKFTLPPIGPGTGAQTGSGSGSGSGSAAGSGQTVRRLLLPDTDSVITWRRPPGL